MPKYQFEEKQKKERLERNNRKNAVAKKMKTCRV